MEKRHRIFIAVNLPADIKRGLVKYYDKWPELPAKWTPQENLHITLEFLGDLTDIEIGEVCMVVKDVVSRHSSFSINLKRICYGPIRLRPGQGPKFVWAEGEKSEGLTDLREDLQNSLLKKVSFRPEERIFSPHITLARISEWEFKKFDLEERPEINEDIDLVFTAESIEVMESELGRTGPKYTALESHSLKL